MKLHALPKIKELRKKRLGRGHGSGKVKTSGRGTKGQKARGTVHAGFEGGQVALRHRLPFLRGKGRNDSKSVEVLGLPLTRLKGLSNGETITLDLLKQKKIITARVAAVKLIGNTPVDSALNVEVPTSKGAKQAIEKAGGSVTV